MTGKEYVEKAMRTNDGKSSLRLSKSINRLFDTHDIEVGDCIMACLGLSGEVGEFTDMMKKVIFHEAKFEEEHAKKELGDILWYIACMAHAFGWDLDEIMQTNIDKLKARYPEGFDIKLSAHRKEGDI